MPPKKTKKANLHIRLPEDELLAGHKAAERARVSFTIWLRMLIRRAAGMDVPPVLPDET